MTQYSLSLTRQRCHDLTDPNAYISLAQRNAVLYLPMPTSRVPPSHYELTSILLRLLELSEWNSSSDKDDDDGELLRKSPHPLSPHYSMLSDHCTISQGYNPLPFFPHWIHDSGKTKNGGNISAIWFRTKVLDEANCLPDFFVVELPNNECWCYRCLFALWQTICSCSSLFTRELHTATSHTQTFTPAHNQQEEKLSSFPRLIL